MAGGIIETFYFLFESDARKVQEGLVKSRENATKFGQEIEKADKKVSLLGENFIDAIKGGAATLVAALTVSGLKGLAEKSADATNEMRLLAKQSFKSVEDFTAFKGAVVAAGGSADAFASTLHNLGMRTNQPLNYLLRLANVFKGMSDVRAARFASFIGVDPGMIPFLQQGKDGINKLIDRQLELGIVTKHQADVAKAYKDQLRDTNQVYDDVKRRIATAILPYMQQWLKLLEVGVRWLRDNYRFTIGFFVAVGAAIMAYFMPAIIEATVATIAFLGPWLLIGAAVLAFGAIVAGVFDDVNAYLHAQPSVIGELSKKWPELGAAIRVVADSMHYLWEIAKAFGSFFIDIFSEGFVKAWENLSKRWQAGLDAMGEKFPALAAVITALGAPIATVGQFIHDNWEAISDITEATWNILKAIFESIGNALLGLADLIADGPEAAFQRMGERSRAILKDLEDEFPSLKSALEDVSNFATFMGDDMSAAWQKLIDVIQAVSDAATTASQKVQQSWQTVKGWFSDQQATVQGNVQWNTGAIPAAQVATNAQNVATMVAGAQTQLSNTNTPLNSVSTNSILNNHAGDVSKTTTVTIQELNLQNTAPLDPTALSQSFANDFSSHLKSAIDEHDNGIAG